MRSIFVVGLALILCACQRRTVDRAATSLLKEERKPMQEATINSPVGSEVFLSLADGRLLPLDKAAPPGFYLRGELEGGKFTPTCKQILGEGTLATPTASNKYGWFELADQQFFEMQSGRQAQPPFVKGYWSKENGFTPSSREIFSTP